MYLSINISIYLYIYIYIYLFNYNLYCCNYVTIQSVVTYQMTDFFMH